MPDTCGNRPATSSTLLTPSSSAVRRPAPVMSSTTTTLPNGSSVRTSLRVSVVPAA